MYKIFVLEFGRKSIFLKDLQEYYHLHIFPKSEDNHLFMWFQQHLHWLIPWSVGTFYVCDSPGERWTGNWILTVIFQQSQTPIDQEWKVIGRSNWCHRNTDLIILDFPDHYSCFKIWRENDKPASTCRILYNRRVFRRNMHQIILAMFQKLF